MIGVFDSGYGGLTILKELLLTLPQYDYIYLGDNGRAPYGNHSRETVTNFTRQAVDFLFKKRVRLIIIACNTASALALHTLQEEYLRKPKVADKKILGVIFPIVEKAAEVNHKGRIGVVGTRGTIESGAYQTELKKLYPKAKVYTEACPLLVPLIEENWRGKPEARMILKKYLRPLKSCQIGTLILGCTHYPLMLKDFERIMGRNVQILDLGKAVAEKLKDYLKRHPEIKKLLTQKKRRIFFTTDDPGKFQELGSRFLGQKITEVERVELA